MYRQTTFEQSLEDERERMNEMNNNSKLVFDPDQSSLPFTEKDPYAIKEEALNFTLNLDEIPIKRTRLESIAGENIYLDLCYNIYNRRNETNPLILSNQLLIASKNQW